MKLNVQKKVLVADGLALEREGLKLILRQCENIQIVGEASDGLQAVDLVKKLRPEIVIVEVELPHLNGFEVARQVMKFDPYVKIMLLSAHAEEIFLDHACKLGVSAYLLKNCCTDELAHSIQLVRDGGKFFSRQIEHQWQSILSRKNLNQRSDILKQYLLTPRESEVVQLIAESYPNKQVAASLGISIKTVEKHRQHIMEKLRVHDTAGLTRFACATGMIENPLNFGKLFV